MSNAHQVHKYMPSYIYKAGSVARYEIISWYPPTHSSFQVRKSSETPIQGFLSYGACNVKDGDEYLA